MPSSGKQNTTLWLASQSPRRSQLLQQVGLEFQVQPAHVEEKRAPDETPDTYVRRLAQAKAAHVFQQKYDGAPLAVIGADTVVVVEGDVLEKPKDVSDAEAMLQRLAGGSHTVWTAVALAKSANPAPDETLPPAKPTLDTELCGTEVWMAPLHPDQIKAYVATGDPMDKAGGYGIQGLGGGFVEGIHGCFFNVMGLPLSKTLQLLFRNDVIQDWP